MTVGTEEAAAHQSMTDNERNEDAPTEATTDT